MQRRTAALLAGLVMALTACADKGQSPVTPERSPVAQPQLDHQSLPCGFHNTGGSTYSGSLSGPGDYDIQPCGTYYLGAGTQQGALTGNGGTDYDLYLYKWNGSAWTVVAASASSSYFEQISYSGTVGYYFWEIYSYAGAGNYTFTMNHN
jgi:hypothetical protein